MFPANQITAPSVQHFLDQNPLIGLSRRHKQKVESTRERLIEAIQRSCPLFVDSVRVLLDDRLSRSPTPLLGEMLPWFLCDIIGSESDKYDDLAAGWLALYLAAAALDDLIDETEQRSANYILLPTVLQTIAHSFFGSVVTDANTHQRVCDLLLQAVHFELVDATLQKFPHQHIIEKRHAARLKNQGIVALTALFSHLCASMDTEGDSVILVIDKLLLPFQILDDIIDIDVDIENENYSFVHDFLHHRDRQLFSMAGAIESGSLIKLLSYVRRALLRASFLGRRAYANTPGVSFIDELQLKVKELQLWLRENQYKVSSNPDICSEFRQRLLIVAQSS